jgi:hypothetical protein
MAPKRDNSTNVRVSERAWSELAAALHPKDRFITYVEGEPALIVRVGVGSRVVRIVRELKGNQRAKGEKGKMTTGTNIDFDDQKLATVSPGFDSVEDEQSYLKYLDDLAATQDAEELERMSVESAYQERKLARLVGDNF